MIKQTLTMAGETISVESQLHKALEKALLDQFERITGALPKLNKGKA
jgi:hypothetical protein